jgi:hypothetical protein
MSTLEADALGRRVLAALDLADFGVELTELRLQREHPAASPDEIRRLLAAWLRDRPADAAEPAPAVARPAR